jgi:hypothetical protein
MKKLTLNCNVIKNNNENYAFKNGIHFDNLGSIIQYNHVYDNAHLTVNWNTSILDMLFCCGGRQAQELLKSS